LPFGVFAPQYRVAWSLAADFRRARNQLLRTVFRYWKVGLLCQERSPISPATFATNDERKYIQMQPKSLVIFDVSKPLIHRRAQLLIPQAKSRCIIRWII
jgi:hypothetical protein